MPREAQSQWSGSLFARLRQWPRQGLMALVKGYRLLISPWLGSNCRFEPSCSAYALQALQRHGAGAGTYLTLKRLARCQPWCEGGCDPVPEQAPRLFSRLVDRRASGPAGGASVACSSSLSEQPRLPS